MKNLVLVSLFFSSLIVNIDMGILPAGVEKIKADLELDNAKYGVLGGVDYAGQVIGSMLASWWIGCCNEKYLLSVCLFLNIAVIFLFTNTNVFGALICCRTITGLLQVFISIYMPIWADVFGSEDKKSLMMTLLLISSPLGILIGYGGTAWL